MKILGVNGIRSDGATNTDLMLKDLAQRGWNTRDVNYPRVNIFTARWRSRQRRNAQALLDAHKPGDAVIAHSYGCLLTLRAMEMGAQFGVVFFFGAAMNDDFSFPVHGMKKLFNMYYEKDKALTLGNILWFHDFGKMGQTGYNGPPDTRIINVQANPVSHERMEHSNYFLPENRPRWVESVDRRLRNAGYG